MLEGLGGGRTGQFRATQPEYEWRLPHGVQGATAVKGLALLQFSSCLLLNIIVKNCFKIP